jgi:hypothetical protein
MTTIKAIRLASAVTAINVLVASGFSIAAIIGPQYLVPAAVRTETSLLSAMYAAAPASVLLGTLAGAMQLRMPELGLYEHDPGKCAGPLFIAVLQFFVVYLLNKSVRITPQKERG